MAPNLKIITLRENKSLFDLGGIYVLQSLEPFVRELNTHICPGIGETGGVSRGR